MTNSTVKRKIVESFVELLSQQSFSTIKVTNIISAAGISHMSFYRNYPDKYALLEEICIADFRVFTKIYGYNAKWRDIVMCILSCIKNNQKFYGRALAEDCSVKCVIRAADQISREFTGITNISKYTAAIWTIALSEWRRNLFADSVETVYYTLLSNLPVCDVLPPRDLKNALARYETTTLEEFSDKVTDG